MTDLRKAKEDFNLKPVNGNDIIAIELHFYGWMRPIIALRDKKTGQWTYRK